MQEPDLARGEWLRPAAGHHSYPPRKRRFDAPSRRCPHCGLASETFDVRCPVCGARFDPPVRVRLLRRLRRRGRPDSGPA